MQSSPARPGSGPRTLALALALVSLAMALVLAPPGDILACLTDAPRPDDLQPASFAMVRGLMASLRDRFADPGASPLAATTTWAFLSLLWRFWYVSAVALFALATLRLLRWRPRVAAPGAILILLSMALEDGPAGWTLTFAVGTLGLTLLGLGALWALATMVGFGVRASTVEDLPRLAGVTRDDGIRAMVAAAALARRGLLVLVPPALPVAAALVGEMASEDPGFVWALPLILGGLAGVAGVVWAAVSLVAGPPDDLPRAFRPSATVPAGIPFALGAVALPLVAWGLAAHENLLGDTGIRIPLMLVHAAPLAFLAGSLLLPALLLPVVAGRLDTGRPPGEA